MTGYVVSKGGTFGVVYRSYVTESGVACVLIRWGRLGWLTPVVEADCRQLASGFERQAREEASAWLASLDAGSAGPEVS